MKKIVLSGWRESSREKPCLDCGFNPCLTKVSKACIAQEIGAHYYPTQIYTYDELSIEEMNLITLRDELIHKYTGQTKTPMYWKRLSVLNFKI